MDIRAEMAKRMDAAMTKTLYGTSTLNTAPAEPLTFDKLQKMMMSLPKREMFVSTKLYPGADAITLEGGSTKYTVAHPSFWARVTDHCRKVEEASPPRLDNPFPFSGIRIEEIDHHPDDDAARTIYLDKCWDELLEAVKVACVELPDWLKSAPKFGKHG